MIKTGQLLTPKHWREKINTTCQIFSCTTRRPGHQECFFWVGSVDAFFLKSGRTWPVSGCLSELWYWTVPMATQNPIKSHQRSPSGLPAPKHNISVSFELGGILRAFKSRHTRFTMERIVKAVEEKRTPIEHHESLEGLCHGRCPCCHRKRHERHEARNSKFLLEKTVSRCVWLHRIYSRASEGNHGRDCGNGKRGWKVSRCDPGEIQELIDTSPSVTTWRGLDGDECFGPVRGGEEEDIEGAVPENVLTLDRFRFLRTVFDVFYDMGPSMTWALKRKQMVVEGLVPYTRRNIFREIRSKEVRQKLQCISVKWHGVRLPLRPPLPPPPPVGPLPPLRWQTNPPSQCSQREDREDEGLYDNPLPLNQQWIIIMPDS